MLYFNLKRKLESLLYESRTNDNGNNKMTIMILNCLSHPVFPKIDQILIPVSYLRKVLKFYFENSKSFEWRWLGAAEVL